ncbi:MAG TPA: glycosyltransferase family 39 protein [Abditibacteriaceae bacterium]|nr:glycosyltransferase family 39 protein [Abditibacteriaceae bacterium]
MIAKTPTAAETVYPRVREWTPLAALLVAAAFLRLYRLDSQLWIDEISAVVNSIRRPLGSIATQWPGVGSHPFYELWARACIALFGDTPFAVRLPAAVFGTAGVGALYLLARRVLERRHALAIAALLALSYHSIFFSQNARGYTALIFFFTLASSLLIKFEQTGQITPAGGGAYALVCALAAYSQAVGVFILPAHAGVVLAAHFTDARQHPPLRAYLVSAVVGGVATGLLYLPFVSSLAHYTQDSVKTPALGPRVGPWLLREVVEGLSAAFMGPLGLAAAVIVGLVGLAAWWHRSRFALAVLVAPLALQGVVFAALGVGMYPRYFANALPIALLVGGYGALLLVSAATQRLPLHPARRTLAEGTALAAVVLLSALPLPHYYRTPKQDFLGAMRAVSERAAPSDVKIGVHVAGYAIGGFYCSDYAQIDHLDELLVYERTGRRLWVITTLEQVLAVHDRALHDYIKANYQLVTTLPGTVGHGQMHIYVSERGAGGRPARARAVVRWSTVQTQAELEAVQRAHSTIWAIYTPPIDMSRLLAPRFGTRLRKTSRP